MVGRGTEAPGHPRPTCSGRVKTALGYVSGGRAPEACIGLPAALVLLSDFEAFGLPVAEALMCGTPVVATYGGRSNDSLFAGLPGVELVDNHDQAGGAGSAILRAGQGRRSRRRSQLLRHASASGWRRAAPAKLAASMRALPSAGRRPRRCAADAPQALGRRRADRPRPPPSSAPSAAKAPPGRCGWSRSRRGTSPTTSLLGGGERYVENVCKAVRAAVPGEQAAWSAPSSRSGRQASGFGRGSGTPYDIVAGQPEEPGSIDGAALEPAVRRGGRGPCASMLQPRPACSRASHARLLGRRVLGTRDHGGSASWGCCTTYPRLMGVYDAVVALIPVQRNRVPRFPSSRCTCILGPVDDAHFGISRARQARPAPVDRGRPHPAAQGAASCHRRPAARPVAS